MLFLVLEAFVPSGARTRNFLHIKRPPPESHCDIFQTSALYAKARELRKSLGPLPGKEINYMKNNFLPKLQAWINENQLTTRDQFYQQFFGENFSLLGIS